MNNKYIQMLNQHLSRVVLVILLLLLGVVYWFKSKEQSMVVEGATASEVAKPDPLLPDERFDLVQKKLSPMPPIEQTDIGVVMKFDMFDVKQVQDKDTREQQANALFATAQVADAQGNKEEALRIIEEIFKVYPPHIQAKELRNKIMKEAAQAGNGAAATPVIAENPAPTP